MIVKKVIIDKANRLYQLAPDISSFHRLQSRRPLLRKLDMLDLATFRWPDVSEQRQPLTSADLLAATPDQLLELKGELADWYLSVHGVKINAGKEICVGPGITGLIHLVAAAFIDHGDIAFVPELSIPLYRRTVSAWGGEPVTYMVSPRNNWLPQFDKTSTRLGKVARVLFLNSPHNPTGVELDTKAMSELVWIAGRENIVVINDAAYVSMPAQRPTSLLAVSGGKKVGIELYSFPYSFGLPPLSFGFAVGNRDIISGLEAALQLFPVQVLRGYVTMALEAVRQYPHHSLREIKGRMAESATEAAGLLSKLNLENTGGGGVPFIWARIQRRFDAAHTAAAMYRRHGILSTPGTAFGETGDGYLRFSLTASAATYSKAQEQVKRRVRLSGRNKE